MGLWSYERWEYVLLCVVVDTGVGIAFCCWWVVAWTAGLGLRVGVAFCCSGVGAAGLAMNVGSARRECVLLLRASGVRDWHWASGLHYFSCLRVQDCRIAGLQDCGFIEEQQDCRIGR